MLTNYWIWQNPTCRFKIYQLLFRKWAFALSSNRRLDRWVCYSQFPLIRSLPAQIKQDAWIIFPRAVFKWPTWRHSLMWHAVEFCVCFELKKLQHLQHKVLTRDCTERLVIKWSECFCNSASQIWIVNYYFFSLYRWLLTAILWWRQLSHPFLLQFHPNSFISPLT